MIRTATVRRPGEGIDRRIWWLLAVVSFFAILVVKEVTLPRMVMLAFGSIGLLGLFFAGFQDPAIPLYMLVAYMPFSRVLVGNFGTSATALNFTNILMVWVLIGHIVYRISRGQQVTQSTPLDKLVWLFALLGSISLFRGAWQYGSWYIMQFLIPLKQWLTPIGCYFLVLWLVRDKTTMRTIVVLIMFTVVVVALMAIRDYLDMGDVSFERSRIGGIAQQPNTLGAFFNYYMFLFAAFWLIYIKRPKAWWLLVPFLICFRGIMVTFSRGAYLGFAAGSMALAFVRSRMLFFVVLTIAVLMAIHPAFLPAGIRYRMGMTMERPVSDVYDEDLTETLESSAALRLQIWQGALRMIQHEPWFGVGYGAFPRLVSEYTDVSVGYRDAHNSYLLIAAEMGIPTLVVFLVVLVVMAYYAWWLYRKTEDDFFKSTALGVLAGIAALLVANMFGSRMDDQAVASYFWILAAIVMRAVMMERQIRSARTVKVAVDDAEVPVGPPRRRRRRVKGSR